MTATRTGVAAPQTVDVTKDDTEHLRQVADGLRREGRNVDDARWVIATQSAYEDTPLRLRKEIRSFRRHTGDGGVLLIRGLPVTAPGERLAATPRRPESAQLATSISAAILLMVAHGLGAPAAYRQEKSGALVHDVVPVPGKEEFQGNAGSVTLSWHIENAFHPHRPDFILLSCLRADHDRVAALRTACIRPTLPLIDSDTRETLFRPEFLTAAPPSFQGPAGWATEARPVLSGDPQDPELCVDMAATRPLTERAAAALGELETAMDRAGTATRLEPGDLAIVDNRTTAHGRSSFRPHYDGNDRWLQRTYALADLRRSRKLRPADGYVLAR